MNDSHVPPGDGVLQPGGGAYDGLAQRLQEELQAAGVLLFVVKTHDLPLVASINSRLTWAMMSQIPSILRRTADMIEQQTVLARAAPPPGTKLS